MKTKSIILTYCAALIFSSASATQDTVKVGSFIINMGITPQTVANGLKPYGLLYELLKTHKVPVWWVINPSKTKDGIDFTHNGVNYRGGTFIIPSTYMTADISSVVASWQAQGVIGATAVSPFVVDIFMVLKFAPRWTMDKDNGSIAVGFFNNAGIPSSAYGGSSSLGWKTPAQLDACDDLFVMPHADPTWATHNNLYYWNLNYKGNIWAGCHAVSVIENTTDSISVKMNFLTTNGMVPFASHGDGALPFSYQNPTDPIMQFMGSLDGATNNGSERQFLPSLTSAWRATTSVGAYASVHPDIPSLSAGKAAATAYGRGFGDTSRGYVMYEGGHNINGGMMTPVADKVAAQRAFFNYCFFATTKTRDFNLQMVGAPTVGLINASYNLSFTVPDYINPGSYTIKWTTTGTGTFSPNDYSQNVTYTPTGSVNRSDKLIVSLSDACGRVFASSTIIYMSGVLVKNKIQLKAERISDQQIKLKWSSANNNISVFEVERSQDNKGFKKVCAVMPNQNGKSDYTYVDFSNNSAFYRIKIIEQNGNVSYSSVASIGGDSKDKAGLTVVNNPVRGSIQVLFGKSDTQAAYVDLINMQGKIILQQPIRLNSNESQIQINLPATIIPGYYLVRLTSGTSHQTVKVLVQ